MLKRLAVLAALAAAVFCFNPLPPAYAAEGLCDAQRSPLCVGLVEQWGFNEGSDAVRFGAFKNTMLLQPDGQFLNLGGAKLGYASVWFEGDNSGNEYLWIPRYGDFGAYATVAMWVKQTTQTGQQWLVSTVDPLYSQKEGTILYLDGGKPTVQTYEAETDTSSSYQAASAISANTWHLLVFKLSPYGTYGKAQACVSVDNGAFSCGSLGYNRRAGAGDLYVGGRSTHTYCFQGYIDELLIASRAWSPDDVSRYYNSGSGVAFPFY